MSDENPSVVSHISIGTNDYLRAQAFYDAVMATLGAKRILEHPGATAYGKLYPEFWVQVPHNEQPASIGNGFHIGFFANSKEQVDAFHAAALKAGGIDDGAPGPRPMYGAAYYGGFVRDPDGHKIEASFWDESLANE